MSSPATLGGVPVDNVVVMPNLAPKCQRCGEQGKLSFGEEGKISLKSYVEAIREFAVQHISCSRGGGVGAGIPDPEEGLK